MEIESGVLTGIFPGNFNPISLAHLKLAVAALEQRHLHHLIFLPRMEVKTDVGAPVHRAHRLRMIQEAIEHYPRFELSDYWFTNPKASVPETCEFFSALHRGSRICWIIGTDDLSQLFAKRINTAAKVMDACDLVVMERGGTSFDKVLDDLRGSRKLTEVRRTKLQNCLIHTPDVKGSGAEIRKLAAAVKPLDDFVLPEVEDYIDEACLYVCKDRSAMAGSGVS